MIEYIQNILDFFLILYPTSFLKIGYISRVLYHWIYIFYKSVFYYIQQVPGIPGLSLTSLESHKTFQSREIANPIHNTFQRQYFPQISASNSGADLRRLFIEKDGFIRPEKHNQKSGSIGDIVLLVSQRLHSSPPQEKGNRKKVLKLEKNRNVGGMLLCFAEVRLNLLMAYFCSKVGLKNEIEKWVGWGHKTNDVYNNDKL